MYQRILVPIDGSATARRGLAEAITIAQSTGAQLRLIHVVDELSFTLNADAFSAYSGEVLQLLREGGERIVAAARATVEAAQVPVDAVLRDSLAGRVCDQVIEEAKAWPADLIVIGTHGRRGVGRLLLGSDAEQILRLAPIPVLLVRTDEPAAG